MKPDCDGLAMLHEVFNSCVTIVAVSHEVLCLNPVSHLWCYSCDTFVCDTQLVVLLRPVVTIKCDAIKEIDQ